MYRVLIIDDEPWSREVVKALGKWNDMKLSVAGEAEDGTQGLEMIRQLNPDIVVTDMRMPGIEGVELLKAINENFPLIKIIIMSGYDDFVYLKQAIRSKAVEYLLKPIDPLELNASLKRCIEEIDKNNSQTYPSLNSQSVFNDSDILDRYLAYRKLLYGYMLELNKAAVLETLDKLKAFIYSYPSTLNNSIFSKIGNDFILLLEEFLSGNEVEIQHIWNEKNRGWAAASGWSSIDDVIADISWLYGNAIAAVEASIRKKNSLDLEKVEEYIERYFIEPITLESIAQHFFVSKEHLSRSFKSFKGENISDYIMRLRMEKAKELILEKGLEIKNAAQMTGYSDLAYFYRVFKRYFGFTPGELRVPDSSHINKVQ